MQISRFKSSTHLLILVSAFGKRNELSVTGRSLTIQPKSFIIELKHIFLKIKLKYSNEALKVCRMQFCTKSSGQMTVMAAILISLVRLQNLVHAL